MSLSRCGFIALLLLTPSIAFAHTLGLNPLILIYPFIYIIGFVFLLYHSNKNGGSIARKILRIFFSSVFGLLVLFIGWKLYFFSTSLIPGAYTRSVDESYRPLLNILGFLPMITLGIALCVPMLARKIIK